MNYSKWLFVVGSIFLILSITVFFGIPPAESQTKSTYDIVKERGKLMAGVPYDKKPWGYMEKDGKVVGFAVDIAKAIAKDLGVELVLKEITPSTRGPLLQSKGIDMVIDSTLITRKRFETVRWC